MIVGPVRQPVCDQCGAKNEAVFLVLVRRGRCAYLCRRCRDARNRRLREYLREKTVERMLRKGLVLLLLVVAVIIVLAAACAD